MDQCTGIGAARNGENQPRPMNAVGVSALGSVTWDTRIGVSFVGCAHWDQFRGMLGISFVGCAHWDEFRGMLGTSFMGCVYWDHLSGMCVGIPIS